MSSDLRRPVTFMRVFTEHKGLSRAMYSLFHLNTNLILHGSIHAVAGKKSYPNFSLHKKTHMLILYEDLPNNENRRLELRSSELLHSE
jgi:hypothetical protein